MYDYLGFFVALVTKVQMDQTIQALYKEHALCIYMPLTTEICHINISTNGGSGYYTPDYTTNHKQSIKCCYS